MIKIIFMVFLLPLTFLSCQNNVSENYNYEKDTPAWLKTKIDSIVSTDRKYYFGTQVCRYKWEDSLFFEFKIPLSSCALCELYYYNGTKTNFPNDSTVQNYINNRTDKLLVWKWPEQ